MQRVLDADAAADMLRWENIGFSVDASVRITLFRLQLRVYCQPLEHLLRYCARPPFALERLSVRCGEDGRISRVRYVLPRHKAVRPAGRNEGAVGRVRLASARREGTLFSAGGAGRRGKPGEGRPVRHGDAVVV
ncbi:hypothetical protein LBMAG47_32200 [Planctomycetia bacterium]|nr:hypothetical protein LBMAG47_32200 [Planctomycetia bacterium]